MSGRSTSENQPAPASSSSDADDTRPGSGAILGGVLLVGAAAGYALIFLYSGGNRLHSPYVT